MAGRITWLFMSFLLEEGKEKGCLPACSVGARRERSLAQSGGWWGCFPPNRDQVEAEIRDAAPRHAAAFLRRISTVVPHRSVIIHDSTSGSGRQPNNLYIANNGAPHLRLLSNPSQAPIQFGIRNEMVRYTSLFFEVCLVCPLSGGRATHYFHVRLTTDAIPKRAKKCKNLFLAVPSFSLFASFFLRLYDGNACPTSE